MGQSQSSHRRRHTTTTVATATATPLPTLTGVDGVNRTLDLPDDLLALVFHSLSPSDRDRCALVCRRWLAVDSLHRCRLALLATAPLLHSLPSILSRFPNISALNLKCDRKADSVPDQSLALVGYHCPSLVRIKIRALRAVTHAGMAALAQHCPKLRKISVASCVFGVKGIDAILACCPSLEEISIKRLRGIGSGDDDIITPGVAAASLKSITLKEIYNAQCFAPLIAAASNLRTLKLIRCSGDWDGILEELIASRLPGIVEIHLEKLQVGDRGLIAISGCTGLEVLHLVKTPECTDVGLAAIADKCRMLRKVHIDGWKANRIGDEGLVAVAQRCPNLQELVLIGVNPTAVSLEPIASNCRKLERLALCGSETFGDAEMSCIAAKCLALKKLCIKGCPVSDHGIEALAEGCPNLVKVKVKKCKGVTPEGADWLRATRGSLAVNLDAGSTVERQDGSVSDTEVLENGTDFIPRLVDQIASMNLPSSSGGRTLLRARKFLLSAFRRRSRCRSSQCRS